MHVCMLWSEGVPSGDKAAILLQSKGSHRSKLVSQLGSLLPQLLLQLSDLLGFMLSLLDCSCLLPRQLRQLAILLGGFSPESPSITGSAKLMLW